MKTLSEGNCLGGCGVLRGLSGGTLGHGGPRVWRNVRASRCLLRAPGVSGEGERERHTSFIHGALRHARSFVIAVHAASFFIAPAAGNPFRRASA